MMKFFSVFDSAAGLFGRPFVDQSVGVAVRGFADECRRKESPLAAHPQDYILYELGEFDQDTGVITVLPEPKNVAEAVRFALPPEPPLPFGQQ